MSRNELPDSELGTMEASTDTHIEQSWRTAADSAIMDLAELLGELVAIEEADCEGDR